MAQHTPTLNMLHVLMQRKPEYIACLHATPRQNPCVNQAIKIWEQMNASLINEYSILAILMKA